LFGYNSATILGLAKGLSKGSWFDFVMHKKGFIGTENIYKIVETLTKGRRIEELEKPLPRLRLILRQEKKRFFDK
jgi:hypothetical protein